jgi:SulP family sulfate permease
MMPEWLRTYHRRLLPGDLCAGVIVALMLVPQGMAYALVAGLPPVLGIYAAMLPALAYAVIGTSMTQSVGPMAITSLMTGAALAGLAPTASPLYVTLAAQMALMVGGVLLLCGVLRLGFLASFLSRPVMSGFTNGAALVIASGQLRELLGGSYTQVHVPSLILGALVLALLWGIKEWGAALLKFAGLRGLALDIGPRLLPLAVVFAAAAAVVLWRLESHGIRIVGEVPKGLPSLVAPLSHAHWQTLLNPALLMAFIVFISSMSAAQALAERRHERLRTDRELLGLGLANVASALSGSLPVTGSISRSAVNFAAGANTPLASVISALLLALLLLLPTGWLAPLPIPALSAMIIIAVLGMMDWQTLRFAWRYDRAEAAALLVTMTGVIVAGVEAGVVLGVVLSLASLLWKASRPHMAVIGRLPGSEHFRNVDRHAVSTLPNLLMVRIDAGLFFGNIEAVGERLEQELRLRPNTRELVLVLSAVNGIDTTAVQWLLDCNRRFAQRQVRLHLAEVKGPVMDKLKHSDLPDKLSGQVFLSSAEAFDLLAENADSSKTKKAT